MKKHYDTVQKSKSKECLTSSLETNAKCRKHVSFVDECETSVSQEEIAHVDEENQLKESHESSEKETDESTPCVNMESSIGDDSTLEISDVSGNVSFIKVHGSPELQKSILNASVCVEKLDILGYLVSSDEKTRKKKKGAPICILCKQRFEDKESLMKHTKKMHKRKNVNDCVHCY